MPATVEDVFSPGEDIWKEMCERLGQQVLKEVVGVRELNENPELN